MESWGFPESVVIAVDEHELLDRDNLGPPDIADIVIVANLIDHLSDPAYTQPGALGDLPVCRRLGIDDGTVESILAESEEEIRSMNQALGG